MCGQPGPYGRILRPCASRVSLPRWAPLSAGRRMGAVVLNRLRTTLASAFLAVALLATQSSPWPTRATAAQMSLLGASGLIGFVLGDNYYFRSLLILGPGRGAMVASLAPVFTALLGVPVLGETLGPLALA